MLKNTLPVLFLLITTISFAQDLKQKEVGILMKSLDNFGLTYRTGSKTALWRFSGLSLYGSKNNQDYNKSTSYNISLKAGREFRNDITNKLELRTGLDVSLGYLYSKNPLNYNTKENIFMPGIDGIVGLNFLITEDFIVGAEITPGFYYRTGKRTAYNSNIGVDVETDISEFNFSITNSATLSLIYRFNKD
ncbi:hypothetical protein [Chryseosolibacter indicus]|uniref:Outer membrane protein beta-barrel domain-containing protein n=1 Tax=Chryseosolibacter indicus TaxID=2782351 RepID=A0ABS5VSB3_9BACT|nr:hypothetical protein [Chryseosolibacter indicus]MBT1704313.1 hypothetical protein [Chryseosolibacter indicus]